MTVYTLTYEHLSTDTTALISLRFGEDWSKRCYLKGTVPVMPFMNIAAIGNVVDSFDNIPNYFYAIKPPYLNKYRVRFKSETPVKEVWGRVISKMSNYGQIIE